MTTTNETTTTSAAPAEPFANASTALADLDRIDALLHDDPDRGLAEWASVKACSYRRHFDSAHTIAEVRSVQHAVTRVSALGIEVEHRVAMQIVAACDVKLAELEAQS